MATQPFTGVAVNAKTGAARPVKVSEQTIRRITFDEEFDRCSGPCRCTVETDGECPKGWPSRMRALGFL